MAVSSSGGASRDLLPVPAAERRSTRSLSGQQELNSQLSDLLGGWEEEEETRNDGGKSQSSGQSKPTTSLKNPAPKKNKTTGAGSDDEDDDLFALLAEEKDTTHRTKPKFHAKPLSSRQKTQPSSSEGTPSHTEQQPDTVNEGERPFSGESEERPKSQKAPVEELGKLPESIATRPTVVPGSDTQALGRTVAGEGRRRVGVCSGGRARTNSHTAPGVFEMGNEDDLLSGMGLDDSGSSSQPKPSTRRPTDSTKQSPTHQEKFSGEDRRSRSEKAAGDEENQMFGGYTPSVTSSGPRRQGLPTNLSSSRGSNSQTLQHSRTDKPQLNSEFRTPTETGNRETLQKVASKVPTLQDTGGRPVKKSVRFAETTESSKTSSSLAQPQQNEGLTDRERETHSDQETTHEPHRQLQTTTSGGEGGPKPSVSEVKLEHPVFPWQQRRRRDQGLFDSNTVQAKKFPHISDAESQPTTSIAVEAPTDRQRSPQERQSRREPDRSIVESHSEENKLTDSLKARVSSLEGQLELLERERESLGERVRLAEAEKEEMVGEHKTRELELSSQLDQLRGHVSRVEEAERETTESLVTLRKKMEAVEVSKINELSHLQEIHRVAVADMKREHELDLQRVRDTHRQEIEALKTAHSHTRRLSELTGMVEEATRGLSTLQVRVDQVHKQSLDDSHQLRLSHQQHLETTEQRLNKQYRDIASERDLLRSLAARLEAHLTHLTQTTERERWVVQEDTVRLRAAERALEEQRTNSLAQLDQERRDMTDSKERFLAEQQKLLSECLSERHSLAAERAKLTLDQKRVSDMEKREAQRRQDMEGEFEALLATVTEERARLTTETAHLHQEQSRLRAESVRVEQERQRLERDRASLVEKLHRAESSGQEATRLNQSAVECQREGREMMEAARRLRTELAGQAEVVKRERQELERREGQLAMERLEFARECREHQEKRQPHRLSLQTNPTPILTSTQRTLDDSHGPLLESQSLSQLNSHREHHHQTWQEGKVTPLSLPLKTVLQDTQSDAGEMKRLLQEERHFLDSIQRNNSSLPTDHYSGLHTSSENP